MIETAEADAVLARLAAFAGDMTSVMRPIAGILANETRFNFRRQSSPLGVPWQPSQRALEQGGQTLIDRGDLLGSIRESFGSDFAQAGPEASGAAAIYAAVHQWGARIAAQVGKALRTPFGPRAAVTIPARSYVGWNDRMIETVLGVITRKIAELGGGRGAP